MNRARPTLHPRTAAPWLAGGLALLAAPSVARAQSAAEMATRTTLLQQAQTRHQAGDHNGALDAAQRAGRIQMTPSVRMFIAQEQRETGNLADALGNAELCVREAEHDAALRNRDVILTSCRGLAAELRPRIGQVTVQVPSPAPPGTRVVVAGNALNDAVWGVPFVVTPGRVLVEVGAPGRATFRRQIAVSPGATVPVAVVLPPGNGPGDMGPALSVAGGASDRGGGGINPGPIVVMGLGGVTLGLALVFGLLRNDAVNRLDAACGGPDHLDCPASSRGDYDTASTFTTATNVTLVGGGALLAGGLVWFLVAGRNAGAASPGPRAMVAPSRGGVVFGVEGAL
jgi:hypothetical protein